MEDLKNKKGVLAWFASNHVAANLLLFLILAAGLLTIFTIKMEVFPELSLDIISVTVPYRGASPADVEEGVCIRVEEAVAAVDGVKRLTSSAAEGAGTTTIELEEYVDPTEVLDDVKAEVDRIITFPEETEKPVISEIKTTHKVITIVIYGDVSENTLKKLSDRVRDDITAMENISQVSIAGIRPYEISIEVSEETLRRHGLSFDDVANAVRQSSLDIPAGSVKTPGGEILVRTKGQKYYGPEFEQIIVLTKTDGTNIRLADIATVRDDFEDVDLFTKFDGKRAALIHVSRIGEQNVLDVAGTVKKYVNDNKNSLPEGISIALWEDDSAILKARMNLLKRSARVGLILVFICLTLFLNLRLAFWTTMGIPISFLGAFYLMPFFGVSINMISLFALIMTLGLVVDDAIVVGENIFTYRRQGMDRTAAAVKGVSEMAIPVTLAVLTTIFAFVPLAYTKGVMGKFLRVLPIVVSSVLLVSLIEALLILPAHLSSKRWTRRNLFTVLIGAVTFLTDKINGFTAGVLDRFVHGPFTIWVVRLVRWRYATLATGIAVFLGTIGYVAGGGLKFVFFDAIEADNLVATLTMPQGTPVAQTKEIVDRIEKAALQVIEEYDARFDGETSLMKHISATVGAHPAIDRGGPHATDSGVSAEAHLGEVNIELLGSEQRGEISSKEMKNRWRDIVGEIAGVSSLKFIAEIKSAGAPISVDLSHRDFDTLLEAAEVFKQVLKKYSGVSDIEDSFEAGKAELKLSLKDTGRMLGLTLADLARQVRQGFYGEEAQRIQRGRDDIRVMIRYPQSRRKSLADVENMRIRLHDGTEIPFKTVADVEYGRAYATIRRVDRRRVVTVSADVDEKKANADEINKDLDANVLQSLIQNYPGLQYRFSGERRERNESLGSLRRNFLIAMLAIYGLLAVQFRSYSQPLIVMSAIPFGIVGAIWGHVLMGIVFQTKFNLSILSLFGIVALAGVVVNDSLIMIDLINRTRRSGVALDQVIRESATRRFRPIMLTTLTTFAGLAPMLLEKSLQARFLIPMAISLAFGVMFATVITLFLVPSLYMILEDIKSVFRNS